VLAAVAFAAACSSSGPPHAGPFPGGDGTYVAVVRAPAGWQLDRSGRFVDAWPVGNELPAVAVFSTDAGSRGPALIAEVTSVAPGGSVVAAMPAVDVGGSVDGRRVVTGAPGHLLVDLGNAVVDVRGREVEDEEVRRFAARVAVDSTGLPQVQGEMGSFRMLGALPRGWVQSGASTTATMTRARVFASYAFVSLPRDQVDALGELLVEHPESSFRTESSVYDLDRYPKVSEERIAGRSVRSGMLSARTAALLVPGDPGVAVLLPAYDARSAVADLAVARQLVPSLRRLRSVAVDRLSSRVRSEFASREVTRVVDDRQVLWRERRGGVERVVVVDRTPRYAGPDPAALRNRPALCLVVVRVDPGVVGSDGCVGHEPVIAVGDGSVPGYDRNGDTEVFALAGNDVDRVELRDGARRVATARRIMLEAAVDDRRRLFVLGAVPDDPKLELVALDATGTVLRRVSGATSFHARPG
jgi:hypothetical protein